MWSMAFLPPGVTISNRRSSLASVYLTLSLPPGERQVLGADLNRPEAT
jgi:hypothetical protein